ncbi:hypothetical protein NQ318_009714 [Aromia moschata]|uniref:Transmembrane protein n=1 Tax=Aromia moschata TaxID=1265417 RepID=A0AAV8Y0H6_9CUCU|nr:hypothetical protein NQ318_009714 [Aromia moschata]
MLFHVIDSFRNFIQPGVYYFLGLANFLMSPLCLLTVLLSSSFCLLTVLMSSSFVLLSSLFLSPFCLFTALLLSSFCLLTVLVSSSKPHTRKICRVSSMTVNSGSGVSKMASAHQRTLFSLFLGFGLAEEEEYQRQ